MKNLMLVKRLWKVGVIAILSALTAGFLVACGGEEPTVAPTATTAPAPTATAAAGPTAPRPAATTAPGATAPRPAPTAPSAPSTAAWQAEWDKLVAAAKQEGALAATLFSARDRQRVDKFAEAFPEIKVETTVIPSREIATRVAEERKAGIYNYDLYLSGAFPVINNQALSDSLFEDLNPVLFHPDTRDDSKWIGDFDDLWIDNLTKKYMIDHGGNFSGNTIYYNSSRIKVDSVDQLLGQNIRGKICADDPRVAGAGPGFWSFLAITKGPDFVTRIFEEQNIFISRDRRKLAEDMIKGTFLLCVGPDIAPFQDEGVGLNIVNVGVSGLGADTILPEYRDKANLVCFACSQTVDTMSGDYSSGSPQVQLALYSKAPHPNAAKLFANWQLTKEGQAAWYSLPRETSCSFRMDVPWQETCGQQPQEGKAYFTFHLVTNFPLRALAQNLAIEVFGR